MDFTASLQLPTRCDTDGIHSFADISQEATMNETLFGGGCKAGPQEWMASNGCPLQNLQSGGGGRMVKWGMAQGSHKKKWVELSVNFIP